MENRENMNLLYLYKYDNPMLLLLRSRVSCVRLCATPETAPCQAFHPWDSPGKNTGVGCHFLLQCMKVKVKSLSRVRFLATPWTASHQGPPSMGFSRQEYWNEVPLPSPKLSLQVVKLMGSDLTSLDQSQVHG